MRKLVSLIFLLLMIGTCIRPVLPYLEYALNKDYISKVLCINKEKPKMKCNGKCHLEKQLKKAVEEEKPNNRMPFKRKSEVKEFHIISDFSDVEIFEVPIEINTKVSDSCRFHLMRHYADIDTPPPENQFV